MNSKHRNTLSAIFSHPTPGSLEWRRIEALFVALNAKVIEGAAHEYPLLSMTKKAISTGRIPVRKPGGTK